HGGYSEYFKISEKYVIPLPKSQSPEKVAPLLCAGAIGYRALKLSNLEEGNVLGLIGFGASNHLVLKMAKILYPKSYFIVFARNPKERELALNLGAHLALDLKEKPPEQLHAIIDTTPVWEPPFFLLRYLKPGGRLVINAIRKEDVDKDILKKLSYERDLWLEKEIKSVANITRKDLREFISLAINYGIEPEVEIYPLGGALEALFDIKNRKIRGAKVLKIT
ncbi:MAG: alcohol dehydrogenase, partial [Thermodesulfobacteriaceae bacterium]|nr:alcohol dehydrogenase [Thermodesulfobacteriaceae bacterium]